jgi:cardiolipin synthase A/B
MLTILLTAFATLIVVLVIANLSSGEKKIEHNIERLYASDDPQFLRSMGLLLGPPVIGGNRFEARRGPLGAEIHHVRNFYLLVR